jgi:hypothetical protein
MLLFLGGGWNCPKFEDENLSEKFQAKMELCQIGPGEYQV